MRYWRPVRPVTADILALRSIPVYVWPTMLAHVGTYLSLDSPSGSM